jgi:hypothetical protein
MSRKLKEGDVEAVALGWGELKLPFSLAGWGAGMSDQYRIFARFALGSRFTGMFPFNLIQDYRRSCSVIRE